MPIKCFNNYYFVPEPVHIYDGMGIVKGDLISFSNVWAHPITLMHLSIVIYVWKIPMKFQQTLIKQPSLVYLMDEHAM